MKSDIVISQMIGHIDKVANYTNGMGYDDFVENDVVMDACIFNLSQIGELANRLDAAYRNEHSHIAWSEIYGLRNKIVHDYEGVNFKLVWEIIEDDLPELRKQLNEL